MYSVVPFLKSENLPINQKRMRLKSIDFSLTGGLPILMHFSVIFGRFSNALLPKRKGILRRNEERGRYEHLIRAFLSCVFPVRRNKSKKMFGIQRKLHLPFDMRLLARPF